MRFSATFCAALVLAAASSPSWAQDYSQYSDAAVERELAEKVDVEMFSMVPMRDGVRLATNVYRPKGVSGPLPTILVKTPYNELSYKAGSSRAALDAVKHGYALVLQNERGRFYSEGDWEILGRPQTDGYDTLTWIAKQAWSNGKVGTRGCSSSAEWQLALAGQNHPAHAAMVPMASGAGIGKVGEFQEQGNWYTGGVPRSLFFVWLYGVDNPLRPQPPKGLDSKMIARIAKYNDLAPTKPPVNWPSQIKRLPVDGILKDLGEPAGTFEQLIGHDGPADPAWRKGGLYHDDKGWGVPALWFNSWYDVSIGPNMALFNHARTVNSDKEASANQFVVVTPTNHCAYSAKVLTGPYKSGDRALGEINFDADKEVYAFFDRWLKGDTAAFPSTTPPVRYYAMGANSWKQAAQWPPEDSAPMRLYLRSKGRANGLNGDGQLSSTPPAGAEQPDRYVYDPANPVQTIGGGDCCNGGLVTAGAFDQRTIEARDDVLVYTSEPLTDAMEVTGFVRAVLKVSSDAKDTDFAVKLVDVAPDGTAYILGDTIMRARYRDGYETPKMMTPGAVHSIKPTPITTSNTFLPGHRIRVEITSSNFPKFTRNLNTGGDNESDTAFMVARNAIHHAPGEESYIELPVVKRK
jgi:putative CocE/NonD family hydrolase